MLIAYGDNDVQLIMLLNAPLHIIDHGSVVYLILLQIRFYDQQDSLLLWENNNTVYLILLIRFYDQHNLLSLLRNNEFDFYFDTVFDARSLTSYDIDSSFSAIHDNIFPAIVDADDDSDYFGRILLVIQHDPLIYNNLSSIIDDENNSDDSFGHISNSKIIALYELPSAFHNGIIAAVTIMTTAFDGRRSTGKNDFVLYFDTAFDGCTSIGDNDLYLDFDTVFDGHVGDNNGLFSRVTKTTHHGSVMYFYDQHNLLLLLKNSDTALTKITASYHSNNNPILSNNIDYPAGSIYNRTPSSILQGLTLLSFGTVHSIIVMPKTYNTTYDLHFHTVVAIIVAVAPAAAVGAPSYSMQRVIDSSPSVLYDKTASAVTIMTTAIMSLIIAPLHIINHRSVVYLILLQIRF